MSLPRTERLRFSVILLPPFAPDHGAALLRSFSAQSLSRNEFEIVVPADAGINSDLAKSFGLNLRTFQPASGQFAEQLNQAHLESLGELIFPFFALDLPHPHLLETHLKLHQKSPEITAAVTCDSEFRDLTTAGLLAPATIDPRRKLISRLQIDQEDRGTAADSWVRFSLGLTSYKRELVPGLGGYDGLFSQIPDLDLSFRLREFGLNVIHHRQPLVLVSSVLSLISTIENSRKTGADGRMLLQKYNDHPELERLSLTPNLPDIVAATAEKQKTFLNAYRDLETTGSYNSSTAQFQLPNQGPLALELVGQLLDSISYFQYLVGAAEGETSENRGGDPLQTFADLPSFLFIVDNLPARFSQTSAYSLFETIRQLLHSGSRVTVATTDCLPAATDESVRRLRRLGAAVVAGPLKRIPTPQRESEVSPRADLRNLLSEVEYDLVFVSDRLRTKDIIQEIRRFHAGCEIVVDGGNLNSLRLAQTGRSVRPDFGLQELCTQHRCTILNSGGQDGSGIQFAPQSRPAGSFSSRTGVLLLADDAALDSETVIGTFLETIWSEIAVKNPGLKLFIPTDPLRGVSTKLPSRADSPAIADSIVWCGRESEIETLSQQARAGVVPAGTSAEYRNFLLSCCAQGLPIIVPAADVKRWDMPRQAVIAAAKKAADWAGSINELISDQGRWEHASHLAQSVCSGSNNETSADNAAARLLAQAKQHRPLRRPLPSAPYGRPGMVSIVIPVFNKVEFTRQCVEHIFAATSRTEFEIVIVDNGSSDETAAYCAATAAKYENVRIVTNPINCGFAQGCNQGAEASRGEFILFLNNDTTMSDGWLEPLVAELSQNQNVGAVGAKLLYPDGTIQHAGISMVRNRLCKTFWPFHLHRGAAPSDPAVDHRKLCQSVTGACLLVRAGQFRAVCGFDQEFWNGCEDVDLCFKLRTHGLEIVYQPKSVLIHYEAQSGAERFKCENQNLKRLLTKWGGSIKPDIVGFPPNFPSDWVL